MRDHARGLFGSAPFGSDQFFHPSMVLLSFTEATRQAVVSCGCAAVAPRC